MCHFCRRFCDQIVRRKEKMKCPVKSCPNSKSKGGGKKLSWHGFPNEKDPRRKLWLDLCEKGNYGKNMRMCSDHFMDEDFSTGSDAKFPRLKARAVPHGKYLAVTYLHSFSIIVLEANHS